MADQYIVLDKRNKEILRLPSAALKLWLFYRMNHDEEEESYISQSTGKAQMGMGVKTIGIWTKWLESRGWLVDTGKTAYQKLVARGIEPSGNSKQVHVYQAVEPTPVEITGVPPQQLQEYVRKNDGGTPVKMTDKVSGSGSHSLSSSSTKTKSEPEPQPAGANAPLVFEDGVKSLEANPTNRNLKPTSGPRGRRSLDGTPIPSDFDSMSVKTRAVWLDGHGGRFLKKGEQAPAAWASGSGVAANGGEHQQPEMMEAKGNPMHRSPLSVAAQGGSCSQCQKGPRIYDGCPLCSECLEQEMQRILCAFCDKKRRMAWNSDFCSDACRMRDRKRRKYGPKCYTAPQTSKIVLPMPAPRLLEDFEDESATVQS